MSVSSVDTTFDNKGSDGNKCSAPMTSLMKARLRTIYRANPKKAINLYADNSISLAAEMQYHNILKGKLESIARKSGRTAKSKTTADIEFKVMSNARSKADAFFQNEILDDYRDMKEDDDAEKVELLQTENELLKVTKSLRSDPYAELGLADKGVSLDDIKGYLKSNQIFMSDIKEDDIMMIMLRASDYMEHRGKNYDSTIQSIKTHQKKIINSINKQLKFSDMKVKDLTAKLLNSTDKLREVNILKKASCPCSLKLKQATLPNTYRCRKWISAADVKQSIKAKESVLNWLKEENSHCDALLKKYKDEKLAASMKSFVARKLRTVNPATQTPRSQIANPTNQNIVRLTQCFKKFRKRTIDFSLGIESFNGIHISSAIAKYHSKDKSNDPTSLSAVKSKFNLAITEPTSRVSKYEDTQGKKSVVSQAIDTRANKLRRIGSNFY